MIKFTKSKAQYDFDSIKQMLMDYWENIAINIFEWQGLDTISDSLTSEIIEEILFNDGQAIFFKDPHIGYLALHVASGTALNVYSKPVEFEARGLGYTRHLTVDDSVIIRNNTLKKATRDIIDFWVERLADIELTKQVHRNAHKTPIMLECNDKTELSAKNLFKQIAANEPVIFRNKTRGDGDISVNVLNTNIPYINDLLEDDYHNYEARILTVLGLDNYVEDKKERVQSAEVESNQEYIISAFRVSLEARQKACKDINKMFGTNLSVDYVKGLEIETNEKLENEEEEEEDEQIHSGN